MLRKASGNFLKNKYFIVLLTVIILAFSISVDFGCSINKQKKMDILTVGEVTSKESNSNREESELIKEDYSKKMKNSPESNNENIIEENSKNEEYKKVKEVIIKPPDIEISKYKIVGFSIREARILLDDIENLKKDGVNVVAVYIEIGFKGRMQDIGIEKMEFTEFDDTEEIKNTINGFHENGIKTMIILNFYSWGPTGYGLRKLEKAEVMILKWAEISEKYGVEIFCPINEPQLMLGVKMQDRIDKYDEREISEWAQKILPGIKEKFKNKVAFQIQPNMESGIPKYNIRGYDYALIHGGTSSNEFVKLSDEMKKSDRIHCLNEIISKYPGQKLIYIIEPFTGPDHYFYEPNSPVNFKVEFPELAEDFFMVSEEGQAICLEWLFKMTWDKSEISGNLIKIPRGCEYRDKPAEAVVREWFAKDVDLDNENQTGDRKENISIELDPEYLAEEEFQEQYQNIKITAKIKDNNLDNDLINYSYQWYKNGEAIEGANTSELPAKLMGRQGHTVRGYEYKVEVVAIDSKGNKSYGEAILTIGGPNFNRDIRGIFFPNMWRLYFDNLSPLESMNVAKKRINNNWINISWEYFQSDINSIEIFEKITNDPGEHSTITKENLINQIKYAHSLGLKVMLYPQVWIDGSLVGPRDQIPGSAEWFSSYQSIMLDIADIAEDYDVELLCIGCELAGTCDKEQSWRQLITEVRKHYSGPITFAPQFLYVNSVNWWDAVDFIGVSGCIETHSNNTDPTVDELKKYFSHYRDIYYQLSQKYNKSIVITEVNISSTDGGTIRYGYGSENISHLNEEYLPVDFQEQADYHEAFFETFYEQPWMKGLFVGTWIPTSEIWIHRGPEQEGGWSNSAEFKDKPAEKVIKSWFSP